MGQRRILVIASPGRAERKLSFLPVYAERFYAAMLDPDQGQCQPALPDGGLLLDPPLSRMKGAIRDAYRLASSDQATLFLAFIGHGQAAGEDFYLLPSDFQEPLNHDGAVYLVQLIREEFQTYQNVDGLVVLLDACFAGVAVPDVATRWVNSRTGHPLRFEVLTATGDNPAYDGCFTRILTELFTGGTAGAPTKYLRVNDCTTPLTDGCKHQTPRVLTNSYGRDPGLWLSRNRASSPVVEPWARSSIADEIARLTAHYQPPALLSLIPPLVEVNRAVAITGPAGAGKSAVVAALSRPDITGGAIPAGFLHGIAFLTATTNSAEVGSILSRQLGQSVPGFADCRDEFRVRTQHTPEWSGLDAMHRDLVGPLRLLKRTDPLRIAIDGLDQAPAEAAVLTFVSTVATDPALPFVRLVLTSRSGTPLPPTATELSLGDAPEADLWRYFCERRVPHDRIEATVLRTGGSWLVAELLADMSERDPASFDPAAIPPGLAGVYEAALHKAGAFDRRRWREELRPVLTALAVAGAGPVLPLLLLLRASHELGGPATISRLRDVLLDLRGFVVRVAPGTEAECVGLFHPTLAEHLLTPGNGFRVEAEEGHRAVIAAIEAVAPSNNWDAKHPDVGQRYAFQRHSEHLWAIGQWDEVVECLLARKSVLPRENHTLWAGWLDRFDKLSPDHRDTLIIRGNVAQFTGEVGDRGEALRLYRELLPDMVRVLGPDHLHTLTTRGNLAYSTGEAGDPAEAVRLHRELLPDRLRVLGPDHPDTLTTRGNLAYSTGEAGDPAEAVRLHRELLPDRVRVLGADHPHTLSTRNNLAYWTGKAGDYREAARLFCDLLPDRVRVLGADHPDTRTTRNNIIYLAGLLGTQLGNEDE
jgi:hypothetical protein